MTARRLNEALRFTDEGAKAYGQACADLIEDAREIAAWLNACDVPSHLIANLLRQLVASGQARADR